MRTVVVSGKVSAAVLAGGAVCAVLAGCGSPAATVSQTATVSPGAGLSGTGLASPAGAGTAGTSGTAGAAGTATGADKTVTVGAAANGHHLSLARGEVLVVKLRSNPSTGYSWDLLKVTGHGLREDGKSSYEPTPEATPLPGSGGMVTFRFAAAGKGAGHIELVYRRPWEKNIKPVRTFTLTAQVH